MSKIELTLDEDDLIDYIFSRLEGICHFDTVTKITLDPNFSELVVELRDDCDCSSSMINIEWVVKRKKNGKNKL